MVIALIFILAWFLTALGLAVTGWFEQFSAARMFAFGSFATVTGYLILHRLNERFRGFVRARNLKRLTQGQLLRFYGTLALFQTHSLTAAFAIPTAIIDILIAASATPAAARLVPAAGRVPPGFFVWHAFGLTGLATSVALVTTMSPKAMSAFPMSLVPTFIGPFVTILHLLAIDSARHRNSTV
jgi:hypothetical protein